MKYFDPKTFFVYVLIKRGRLLKISVKILLKKKYLDILLRKIKNSLSVSQALGPISKKFMLEYFFSKCRSSSGNLKLLEFFKIFMKYFVIFIEIWGHKTFKKLQENNTSIYVNAKIHLLVIIIFSTILLEFAKIKSF